MDISHVSKKTEISYVENVCSVCVTWSLNPQHKMIHYLKSSTEATKTADRKNTFINLSVILDTCSLSQFTYVYICAMRQDHVKFILSFKKMNIKQLIKKRHSH